MKESVLLTITSLLSVLLFTLHVADDIVRGFEEGRVWNLTGILIFTVWTYGALVLAGRRSGYVITLLGALLGLAPAILHMMGKGVGGEFARSSGAFFFIWTIMMLGVTALFSVILSVQGLWSMSWARRRASESSNIRSSHRRELA